jgi:hypothetical protein
MEDCDEAEPDCLEDCLQNDRLPIRVFSREIADELLACTEATCLELDDCMEHVIEDAGLDD